MARSRPTILVPLAPERAAPGNPRTGKTLSRLLHAAGAMVAGFCLFALLALIGLETGPVILVLALFMALTPVPIYAALALWIDRFEPEPVRLLAIAFVWGATIAAFAAFMLNTIGTLIVEGSLGRDAAEIYGGSISAPIVEELAKGAILFGIYWFNRHEFDGVLDGVVYAAMVGLGFAATENVLYYGRGAVEEGVVGAVGTFVLRGLMSPFAHPVFTAMTGIGIGIAATTRHPWLRRIAPLAGLGAAMVLHSLWNTSASGGAFFVVYLLIMVPVFCAVLTVALISRRREQALVRRQLATDMLFGLLNPDDLETMSSSRRRRAALRALRAANGKGAGRTLAEFQEVATEIAFHRERLTRGITDRRDNERRDRLQARALALHAQLTSYGGVVAGPRYPTPVFVHRGDVIVPNNATRGSDPCVALFRTVMAGSVGNVSLRTARRGLMMPACPLRAVSS